MSVVQVMFAPSGKRSGKFFGHAFERRSVRIVQANVGRRAHHQRRLSHVRADHAGRTHDGEFFVRYKIHSYIVVLVPSLPRPAAAFSVPAATRSLGGVYLPAVEQGVGDRQFIDAFQLVAEADAPGDGGDVVSGELPVRFIV